MKKEQEHLPQNCVMAVIILVLKKLPECAVSKTSVLDGGRYISGRQGRNAQTKHAEIRLKTIGRLRKINVNAYLF